MDASEFDDINTAIRENGHRIEDFQFNGKDSTQWSPNEIVKIQGSITIKCKSTQKEKSYRTGHGTSSASAFSKDLEKRFFD